MANQVLGQPVQLVKRFDYGSLRPELADQILTIAKHIREKTRRSLVDIIEIGHDLWSIKDYLGHGRFGPWLLAEFGWTDRTARNFMAVAEQFGPKKEMISDLAIDPTAAYLLAAPSAPFEARQVAFDRAQSGEKITGAVVKEILGLGRNKALGKKRNRLEKGRWAWLGGKLDRFRKSCDASSLAEFARQLRLYASALEKEMRDRAAAVPPTRRGKVRKEITSLK